MGVRRLRISGHLLDFFLRDSELWKSSLPPDVHVVEIGSEDPDRQMFTLLIESSEFGAIAEGQLIPFMEATFTRK